MNWATKALSWKRFGVSRVSAGAQREIYKQSKLRFHLKLWCESVVATALLHDYQCVVSAAEKACMSHMPPVGIPSSTTPLRTL